MPQGISTQSIVLGSSVITATGSNLYVNSVIVSGGGGGSTSWGSTVGETDILAAGTTDLGSVSSAIVRITGTSTISGLGSVTAGTARIARLANSLTLVHNATGLILPGGSSISGVTGDAFIAYSLGGGNWKVANYTKADGTPIAIGNLVYPVNAGAVTVFDMPVSSAAVDNTEESYAFKIDGTTVFKVYSQSDGLGSIDTARVEVNGGPLLTGLATYAAGTVYALTNTAAALDFGTTDPAIMLNHAGTWKISACAQLAYAGATVTSETATLKMRRTNNTAADIPNASGVIDLPVSTALTHTYGAVILPSVYYVTVNANDTIALFGNISSTLGAGTITCEPFGTWIMAERLY